MRRTPAGVRSEFDSNPFWLEIHGPFKSDAGHLVVISAGSAFSVQFPDANPAVLDLAAIAL